MKIQTLKSHKIKSSDETRLISTLKSLGIYHDGPKVSHALHNSTCHFFHPKNLVARRAQFNAGKTGQMSFGSWHQIVRLGQEGQKCGAATLKEKLPNAHTFEE
jgi:hypothetical protein